MSSNSQANIRAVVDMPYHAFDAHSGATMLRADPQWMDPFLGVDSYVMPQPFFPPHPHAGMSAVTLMLPEAQGGFINRDSLGDRSEIRPGDLHWTQAGRGMMHEEIPSQPGQAAKGLQVFVNLARKDKQSEPRVFFVGHEAMPVVQLNENASMRIVAGRYGQQASPIAAQANWHTQVNLFDLSLAPRAQATIEIDPTHNVFFVMRSGSLQLLNQTVIADEKSAAAVFFATDQTTIHLAAGDVALRGVLFAGQPLKEPVVSKGPFTGNSEQDIAQYIRQYHSGAMGRLEKSF